MITNRVVSARSLAAAVALFLAIALLLALVVPGLRWGLPSVERNRLTLGEDAAAWRAPKVPASERENPWEFYPNSLAGGAERSGSAQRSAFNVVRSYHPDEYVIFKSLSGMRPSEGKFFHGFFGWPAGQFYIVGGALKIASWAGLVELKPEMDFYFQNPGEMAKLYLVGRWVTVLFAVGCLTALWLAAWRLFGVAGAVAAPLLLALSPIFVVNAHYMTADVPMLFWVLLTLLWSTFILRSARRWAYVLAAISLGLAAATRYQGALACFIIIAAHMARPRIPWEPRKERGRFMRRLDRLFASTRLIEAGLISVIVFLAVNPYTLLRWTQFVTEFFGEMRGAATAMPFWETIGIFAITGFGLAYALCALGAMAIMIRRPTREGLIIVAGLGIPVLLLLLARPVMLRYLMPAAAMPVLLVAWAFALFHQRGVELRRRGSAAIAPLLLIILLATMLYQSRAFAQLYWDKQADTRTRAGEWISQTVWTGAEIAIISEGFPDPWQFDLPPLDATRFNLVGIPMDGDILRSGQPALVVSSDIQYPPLAVRGPMTPQEESFHRMAFEGHTPYEVLKDFHAWPLGWRGILSRGPHDLRYVNPRIVIAGSATAPDAPKR